MSRKLVLCFDGTWNKPDPKQQTGETNVARIYRAVRGKRHDDANWGSDRFAAEQADVLKWYHTGVGTENDNWFERKLDGVLGGGFGYGLSKNILLGYKFLVENYQSGDGIYLFGFSRGAFTARSLAGMIGRVGLVDRNNEAFDCDEELPENPEIYSRVSTLVHAVKSFKNLFSKKRPLLFEAYSHYHNSANDPEARNAFRAKYCLPSVSVHFLGIWDTVGSLGIPDLSRVFPILGHSELHETLIAAIPGTEDEFRFHDMSLGAHVRHAYHALAIDEMREPFLPTLWDSAAPEVQFEQVWFAGAHADVGGGYPDDSRLSLIPLHWMLEKASNAGLPIQAEIVPPSVPQNVNGIVHDSYADFFSRAKNAQQVLPRVHRTLTLGGPGKQSIHPSVFDRMRQVSTYQPSQPKILAAFRQAKNSQTVG